MPVSCPQCPHIAATKYTLKRHILIHSEKQHKCDLCDYASHRPTDLKKHIAGKHEGLFQFQCEICDFKSNSGANFEAHTKTQHTDTEHRPFVCVICEAKFKTAYVLKNHLFTHEKFRKDYACNDCDKVYKTNASLFIHRQATHLNVVYLCSFCDRSFNQKQQLTGHIGRLHSDERPFHCDMCGSKFKAKNDLLDHKKRHSGLRKHSCSKCPMKFYGSRDLKNHFKSYHTPEGFQIRKKKEHHFGTWLANNGFDQVVRNQRVDLRCKENTANWIELDFYIHRASDNVIFIVELV